jgi:hypothetical protein
LMNIRLKTTNCFIVFIATSKSALVIRCDLQCD